MRIYIYIIYVFIYICIQFCVSLEGPKRCILTISPLVIATWPDSPGADVMLPESKLDPVEALEDLDARMCYL